MPSRYRYFVCGSKVSDDLLIVCALFSEATVQLSFTVLPRITIEKQQLNQALTGKCRGIDLPCPSLVGKDRVTGTLFGCYRVKPLSAERIDRDTAGNAGAHQHAYELACHLPHVDRHPRTVRECARSY